MDFILAVRNLGVALATKILRGKTWWTFILEQEQPIVIAVYTTQSAGSLISEFSSHVESHGDMASVFDSKNDPVACGLMTRRQFNRVIEHTKKHGGYIHLHPRLTHHQILKMLIKRDAFAEMRVKEQAKSGT